MKSQSLLLKNSRFVINLGPNFGFSLIGTYYAICLYILCTSNAVLHGFELLAITWALNSFRLELLLIIGGFHFDL